MDHFSIQLGERIKDLRKYIKMTQKELAESICSQAFISQIESGEIGPSSEILYKISQRLGVDVNYFFDSLSSPNLEYVNETFVLIRTYIQERDYESLYRLIKLEKNNPLFQTELNRQFLTWHEGVCIYYLKNDYENAQELFEKALRITNITNKVYTERELEILLSEAIIYSEIKDYDKAVLHFKKVEKAIKQLPVFNDFKILIRFYFNYSRCLSSKKEYLESIILGKKGMRVCKLNSSFYALGELYFQTAVNYSHLMDGNKNASDYFTLAISIFQLSENTKFEEIARRSLARLSENKE